MMHAHAQVNYIHTNTVTQCTFAVLARGQCNAIDPVSSSECNASIDVVVCCSAIGHCRFNERCNEVITDGIHQFSLFCVSGQYRIQDLDKVMFALNKQFGKIAKVGGLIGHPDLLFVFDADEIRNIFKKEETLPHRYTAIATKTKPFLFDKVSTEFSIFFSALQTIDAIAAPLQSEFATRIFRRRCWFDWSVCILLVNRASDKKTGLASAVTCV